MLAEPPSLAGRFETTLLRLQAAEKSIYAAVLSGEEDGLGQRLDDHDAPNRKP
jgi:hypothetical protein